MCFNHDKSYISHVTLKIMKAIIDQIRPNPYDTREDLGDLEGLKASIRKNGFFQPLIVRPAESGTAYELVFGGRRLQALRELGYTEVDIDIRKTTDADMAILALCENVHRKDLNPVEQARAYRRGLDATKTDIQEFSKVIGENAAKISSYLAVLELPIKTLENKTYNSSQLISLARLNKISSSSRVMLENAMSEREISGRFIQQIVSACESIAATRLPIKKKNILYGQIILQDYSHLRPENYSDIRVFAETVIGNEVTRHNKLLQKTVKALEKARKMLPKRKVRTIKDVTNPDRELNSLTAVLRQNTTLILRAYRDDIYKKASLRSQGKFRTSVGHLTSGIEKLIKDD